MRRIRETAVILAEELVQKAGLKQDQIVIIGCSTSEVAGLKIGSDSNQDIALALYEGFAEVFDKKGIYIAAQCCEHLNRAIVVERKALPDAKRVNAVPMIKAGGAFATVTYQSLKDPILIEEIEADAGIDIGGTLIGMHLKKVAVPLRLSVKMLGEAVVLAARTRPKFIGGTRTVYDETML